MIIKKYSKFLENKDLYYIIPDSIKVLNRIFSDNNKKLYLVGGAIRDFINNETPKDFDLCTDATPDEILNILKGYRTNQQGKSFGVIVVYTDDQPMGMEIATFREDIYGDKLGTTRNPDVKFSTIEKDVLRRDIPFNAMFYDLDKKEIVDLVGGQEDIKNKITRFVGDPDARITEDPLRILRLLRFSCRYQFEIDINTRKSILKNKESLSIISKERIFEEFEKSWKQAKDFNRYLNFYTEFDMWGEVFPGAKINTELVESNDFVVVIANLFKLEKPDSRLEDKLVQEYKIKGEIAKKVIFLLNILTLKPEDAQDMFKKKQQCFIKDSTILEWLEVNGINDPVKIKFLEYKPSVDSQELMKRGFKGRDLGLEIKRLELEAFNKILNN